MIKIDIKIGIDLNNGNRRMSYRGRAQYGQNFRGGCSMIIIIEVILGKVIIEEHKVIEVRILEVDIEVTFRNDNFGRGRSRSRERQYSGNCRRNDRSSSRSCLRASTHTDRVRCSKCREYNHFTKDCLNISDAEKDMSEHIQQMFNLEADETTIKDLTEDTIEILVRVNSEETIDHLNY